MGNGEVRCSGVEMCNRAYVGWGEKHTRVALIGVLSQILALGDLQVRLGDDLVEGVCAAGELLAGVAMAIVNISSVKSSAHT